MSQSVEEITVKLTKVLKKMEELELNLNASPEISASIKAALQYLEENTKDQFVDVSKPQQIVEILYHGKPIVPIKYPRGSSTSKPTSDNLFTILDEPAADGVLRFLIDYEEEADDYISDAKKLVTIRHYKTLTTDQLRANNHELFEKTLDTKLASRLGTKLIMVKYRGLPIFENNNLVNLEADSSKIFSPSRRFFALPDKELADQTISFLIHDDDDIKPHIDDISKLARVLAVYPKEIYPVKPLGRYVFDNKPDDKLYINIHYFGHTLRGNDIDPASMICHQKRWLEITYDELERTISEICRHVTVICWTQNQYFTTPEFKVFEKNEPYKYSVAITYYGRGIYHRYENNLERISKALNMTTSDADPESVAKFGINTSTDKRFYAICLHDYTTIELNIALDEIKRHVKILQICYLSLEASA